MLTLEQVQAVNDGLKAGDLNAALRPLEETIDLRSNELPRLDKAAQAALKSGLSNGDNAAIWADAILHSSISVHRFARKIFMGMGDDGAPLFDPLRSRIERYWGEVEVLPEGEKPREMALHNVQFEMVDSALELLLRANPERFLEFYADVVDATPIDEKQSEAQQWKERNQRNSQAWDATEMEVERLLTEEWGSEWAEGGNRWKLPSRVINDIDTRARQKPEIAALWEQIEEDDAEEEVHKWDPVHLLSSSFGGYLFEYAPTGPKTRVNQRLRPILWGWLYKAFDFESSSEERARFARRFNENYGWWSLGKWFGTQRFMVEMPALLLRAYPFLKDELKNGVDEADDEEDAIGLIGEAVVAQLWSSLLGAASREFQLPYNVEPKDWDIPAEVEPEMLRQLAVCLKGSKGSEYMVKNLVEGAEAIEKARDAKNNPQLAEEKAAMETTLDWDDEDSESGDTILSEYDTLPEELTEAIYEELGETDAAEAKILEELKKVEQEIADIEDKAERVKILLEPPPHPRGQEERIARLDYWKIWERALGENGPQKLKEQLWGDVEPQLWTLLDAKLEAYRRVETDPVEPKIEQKLTKNELKEWKAQARRDKRSDIEGEIWGIGWVLRHVDGLPARLRMIEMLDRPSCRNLCEQMELTLISDLDDSVSGIRARLLPALYWKNWKLGEEWDGVLRKGEAHVEKAKEQWQRSNLERQLAVGYYRRGQFEKFKELVERTRIFPRSVAAAALAFDDFEAWRVLIPGIERWWSDEMSLFWENQLRDSERKQRAIEVVVGTLAVSNNEDVARQLLEWVKVLSPLDLMAHVAELGQALESALTPVKKWAMATLMALPESDFDVTRAAATTSEALWSDNLGLIKDAAKFLAHMGLQFPEAKEVAWEALCDATALENMGVVEAIYRSLSQLKGQNKELELTENAHEKLENLVAVHSDRFLKFQKKLT